MSPRLRTAVRWTVGIAVIAVLVGVSDPQTLASELRRVDLGLAALGIALLTAVHLVAAEAWRLLTRRIAAVDLSRSEAVTRYYVSQALGGITPANIGGDVYRVQVTRSSAGGYAAAAAPVVVQRATSYLALSLLGVVALGVLAAAGSIDLALALPGLVVVLGGIAFAAFLLVPAGPMRRWRGRLLQLALGGADTDQADAHALRLRSSTLIGLVLGLAFHAFSVLATTVLLAAVDPAAVSPMSIAALAVARLAITIPISPSGLGFQEGALSALFIGIGLSPVTALGALLLGRLSLLTTAAVGGLALALTAPRGLRRGKPATTRHRAATRS
jgi:uncharacterized membrane protein YbhN (UPF0104 family)